MMSASFRAAMMAVIEKSLLTECSALSGCSDPWGSSEERNISRDDFRRLRLGDNPAAFDEKRAIAKSTDDPCQVTDHENCMPGGADVAVTGLALCAEAGIANSECFIQDQHFLNGLK